ncbi:hypothetical protein GQX74_005013 [Glossina fuscipes]|nr:hypothetical protein GQX74_005013 [Glossina fuscipes]
MTSSYDQEAYEEQNLRQELRQHLLQNNPNQSNDKNHHQQHNHSSDSDSALSSAPPSISPQPPANGVEPTDIWQTVLSNYISTKTPLRAAFLWNFTVSIVANIQGFSTSTKHKPLKIHSEVGIWQLHCLLAGIKNI